MKHNPSYSHIFLVSRLAPEHFILHSIRNEAKPSINSQNINCVMHTGINPWWRHQMETFSALLAICAGNSPVTGEFPTQRPVTRGFDFYFDLRPNERLNKQSWGWWFETLSSPLWRHRNDFRYFNLCALMCYTKRPFKFHDQTQNFICELNQNYESFDHSPDKNLDS